MCKGCHKKGGLVLFILYQVTELKLMEVDEEVKGLISFVLNRLVWNSLAISIE